MSFDLLETLSEQFSWVHMEPYEQTVRGNPDLAIALYEWNIRIAGAFLEDLAIAEVLLRNALDRELRKKYQPQPNSEPWYLQNGVLYEKQGNWVDATIKQLKFDEDNYEPDQNSVIPAMSLGFWEVLLSPTYQTRLWPLLKAAFPYASRSGNPDRANIHELVRDMRILRNDIAHHKAIFNWDFDQSFRNIKTLTGYITPTVQNWLVKRSRVGDILSRDPLGRQWKTTSQ